jgi:hypothetical protein
MVDQVPAMTPVKSSNIAEVGHDGAALYVRFKGKSEGERGPLYRYRGVAAEHAPAMIASESPGSYFHRAIKGAHYPHEKVEEG